MRAVLIALAASLLGLTTLTASAQPPVGEDAPPAFMDARTTPASTRAPLVRDPARLPDFALFRECDRCPDMVLLPRGALRLGSPSGERSREEDEDDRAGVGGAQRSVTIPRFAISRFETTWEEWDACAMARQCGEANAAMSDGGWGRARRPVMRVNWTDAGAYATFVNARSNGGYRLPSEAEWEYAARAGTRTRFSWGDDDPSCEGQAHNGANFSDCTDDRTRPVGSFRANPWGLFDMHGNVWEWVQDCYADSYAERPADSAPHEIEACPFRLLRGGAFNSAPRGLRSAYRGGYAPAARYFDFGIRLARTID